MQEFSIFGVCQKTGRTHTHALREPIPCYALSSDSFLLDRLQNMKGLHALDPTRMEVVVRANNDIDIRFRDSHNVLLILSPIQERTQEPPTTP